MVAIGRTLFGGFIIFLVFNALFVWTNDNTIVYNPPPDPSYLLFCAIALLIGLGLIVWGFIHKKK